MTEQEQFETMLRTLIRPEGFVTYDDIAVCFRATCPTLIARICTTQRAGDVDRYIDNHIVPGLAANLRDKDWLVIDTALEPGEA